MKAEKQTSEHLLLASVATGFSIALILLIPIMLWELWTIPLILAGTFGVWFLYIGGDSSDKTYENLCAGLILIEFLFFGVHNTSLFDIPAVACIVLFIFSMLGRKRLLYITAALYVLELLYHTALLHTVSRFMSIQDFARLASGALVVTGAVEIARYRINRRLAERQKHIRTLAQLEISGRQNVVFLSNVSHEFRTPINMVLGISEIMLEKDISPEIREDIQSIQLAGKRLSSQISNILDYTEIVEGSLIPAKEDYIITSIIYDVITNTAIRGGTNHLEFVFDIDPKMPSVLIGDAEKITHILKTVLENSIKFTEEGGINICIAFRRESYGTNLIIDIYDTGIGMTDEQIAQIYDDFYQADSSSSRFSGGIGLGIPIVQGILRAMGGFIHFESGRQQGLHTHIVIPQGVANDTPILSIPHVEDLCIACYFRPEKYSCDEVRRYYDKLILHLVEGLQIEGYQAHNFEGLLKLQRSHNLTHVFIAQNEYEENSSYYEELTNRLQVVVIAETDFVLSQESRLLAIRKPFSVFSVVNLLNGEMRENGFKEAQSVGDKPFSCVNVRVLVVDDEEMNLVVAKGVLGSYGIQVDTCLSGKEAIERCDSISYDIIFLDHMMPGFDGVQTLRYIREMKNGLYQDLPIVALTANTISGAREMFRNEGFTEFVPKPIERVVLERVLRRILPSRCIRYSDTAENSSLISAEPSAGDNEASLSPDAALEQGSTASGNAIPFAKLTKVGINVEKGLDYCCGDSDFYQEMLHIFYSQSQEKMDELSSLYQAANWKDYTTKVHALKSTSLTIGAEKLSEYAKSLEQAGKKADEEYIHKNHSGLLRMYQEICESISEV